MKSKRLNIIAAIIFLIVGILWVKGFWFTEVFQTHKSNEPHRAALLQIHEALTVGDSHTDVLAAYWQHRTESLRLLVDKPTSWIITTPLEFGAGNLKLLIEFQEGRVTEVRLRTQDGPPPSNGPKDK